MSNKMKTHKGVKKRFRLSGTGKVKHRPCGTSHRNVRVSAKRKRRLRGGDALVHETFERKQIQQLAYRFGLFPRSPDEVLPDEGLPEEGLPEEGLIAMRLLIALKVFGPLKLCRVNDPRRPSTGCFKATHDCSLRDSS